MSFLGLAHFGLAPEKRNDQVNADVEAVTKAANNGDDSNDSSADVADANANAGNGFSEGPAVVSAPKVATATSKNVSVQHSAGASKVRP